MEPPCPEPSGRGPQPRRRRRQWRPGSTSSPGSPKGSAGWPEGSAGRSGRPEGSAGRPEGSGGRAAGWPHGPGPLPVLPVVLALVQVSASRAAGHGQPAARALDLLGYALLLAGPAALLWRRRNPLLCLLAAVGATVAYFTLGYPRGPGFLAAVVALFGAVQAGRRAPAWIAAGTGWLVWAAAGRVWPVVGDVPLARPGPGDLLFVAAWLVVVLTVAEAGRARRVHFAEVARARADRQRAVEQQERARIDQERRQASEERLRIARELHDVLGHHLSLINVQAGVGLHLMDERPELARSALTEIKKASAEALREVRAVLAALRPADETAPRTPAPGVGDLAALVAGVRAAGLPVQVTVAGAPRPVPAEVDRAVYRIVQEALTNVRRHAGAAAGVTVHVRYDRAAVEVRVVDDGGQGDLTGTAAGGGAGPGAGRPDRPGTGSDGEGAGLAGMRERVAALGGTLRAGPLPAGGFEVYGRLPTGEES